MGTTSCLSAGRRGEVPRTVPRVPQLRLGGRGREDAGDADGAGEEPDPDREDPVLQTDVAKILVNSTVLPHTVGRK